MLQFSSDFLEKFNSSALLPNPFDNHDRNFRPGQRNGSVGGDPILWRRLKTFVPWFTPNRHLTNTRAQSTKCKYMASKSPLLNGSTLGQRDVQANDKGREQSASSKFIHALTCSFIHCQYLSSGMHSARLDKIEGFCMVQTEYPIPNQSPDLALQSSTSTDRPLKGEGHFVLQPKFLWEMLGW